jgi:hypothetical protein
VGLRIGFDEVANKEICVPCWESNSSRPALSHFTVCAIPDVTLFHTHKHTTCISSLSDLESSQSDLGIRSSGGLL